METKELKIQIPEGFEIDKENSSFEKIVFKKKENNTKPRSWEEYCEQQMIKDDKGYFIESSADICECYWNPYHTSSFLWKNVLPSKELAEAFLAMMQLMSLRYDWIHKWSIDSGMTDDWKPDWKTNTKKWCILFQVDKITVDYLYFDAESLTFPTEEIAVDFMNCFKDLLEIAKPLI